MVVEVKGCNKCRKVIPNNGTYCLDPNCDGKSGSMIESNKRPKGNGKCDTCLQPYADDYCHDCMKICAQKNCETPIKAIMKSITCYNHFVGEGELKCKKCAMQLASWDDLCPKCEKKCDRLTCI